MRTRHAREIRLGITLFRLNWPRFGYRNADTLIPSLTRATWRRLEEREFERAKPTRG